jgi:predicted dienelactone hydrolase
MTTSKIQAFALAACAAAALLCTAGTAQAQYQKGPDPTASALERNGPFAIRSTSVSSFVSGFGGGRLYYPTATGTYGAIAVSPGYTGTSSTMTFWGERLASHGFVVIVIDTNTLFDQPDSRARQLKAALDYLASQNSSWTSPIRGKVDTSRRAVAGHSMGGGGSLLAARDNPSYKAAIPMAPWNLSSTAFSTVRVPAMIFGCQDDTIAPVSSHAIPFYNAIPSSTRKNYVEIRNDDHFCVMNGGGHDATLGKLGISWMKRFVDNDTRYSPFVCGTEYNRVVSSYEVSRSYNNCPY